jgi:hypothetical protein
MKKMSENIIARIAVFVFIPVIVSCVVMFYTWFGVKVFDAVSEHGFKHTIEKLVENPNGL